MSKAELRANYTNELEQLQEDMVTIVGIASTYRRTRGQLQELAKPSDEDLADSVIKYNSFIAQAANFGIIAAGCGCSVALGNTSDFQSGIAQTIFYERAQAERWNVHQPSGEYSGSQPKTDAADLNLNNGTGSNTGIIAQNLGQGRENKVVTLTGAGSSVIVKDVLNTPGYVSSCSSSCNYYRQQQEAAIQNANDAKAGRTNLIDTSDAFKAEATEYNLRVWAYERGKTETQEKINRIETFLPNIEE
jgi:hypothetical protein